MIQKTKFPADIFFFTLHANLVGESWAKCIAVAFLRPIKSRILVVVRICITPKVVNANYFYMKTDRP